MKKKNKRSGKSHKKFKGTNTKQRSGSIGMIARHPAAVNDIGRLLIDRRDYV